MAKSLMGPNPDLDDVEFVQAIEAAFGIHFSRQELDRCHTVGDLYDLVCRHVKPVERSNLPCLSAVAYRRLKNAIANGRAGPKFRPDTPLRAIVGGQNVSQWWRHLERESGLRLPALTVSGWSIAILIASVVVTGVVAWAQYPAWKPAIMVLPGLALLSPLALPRRLPVATLGDLARRTGALNIATLSMANGDIRAREVWLSILQIAREYAFNTENADRETALIG